MKSWQKYFLRYSMVTVIASHLSHASDNSPTPPALAPFADPDKPTEQVVTIKDLLAFLPEVLATGNNNYSLTKDVIMNEMGMGLEMAAQQGRHFSESEIVEVIRQLVDAMINLEIMLELANADGITPDTNEINNELTAMKSQLGEEAFNAQLSMQGIDIQRIRNRLTKKQIIDHWIEDKIMPTLSLTDQDINSYYQTNRDQFEQPEQIRYEQIIASYSKGNQIEQEKALEHITTARNRVIDTKMNLETVTKDSGEQASLTYTDLGYITRDTPVSSFGATLPDQVLNLAVGDISAIVSSPHGYHLFKATDRIQKGLMPLTVDLKIHISRHLKQQKLADYLKSKLLIQKQERGIKLHF